MRHVIDSEKETADKINKAISECSQLIAEYKGTIEEFNKKMKANEIEATKILAQSEAS